MRHILNLCSFELDWTGLFSYVGIYFLIFIFLPWSKWTFCTKSWVIDESLILWGVLEGFSNFCPTECSMRWPWVKFGRQGREYPRYQVPSAIQDIVCFFLVKNPQLLNCFFTGNYHRYTVYYTQDSFDHLRHQIKPQSPWVFQETKRLLQKIPGRNKRLKPLAEGPWSWLVARWWFGG